MSDSCRSCGASILWAVTTSGGKRMPIDAEPDEDGLIEIVGTMGDGTPVVEVTGNVTLFDTDSERYTSHFATCPDADDWRHS